MVKVSLLETALPLATVRVAVPGFAIREAGTLAWIWVALEPDRIARLVVVPELVHWTVERLSKLLPVRVRVKAVPFALAKAGLRLVRTGAGPTARENTVPLPLEPPAHVVP